MWLHVLLVWVAALLLGCTVVVAGRPCRRGRACVWGRGGVAVSAPAVLGAGRCCGLPPTLYLGATAASAVWLSPWLMLPIVVGLAVHLVHILRNERPAR